MVFQHSHPLPTIVYQIMGFLLKQPSVLLRILCASHCPPHSVLHNIYPVFYNPLYYPLYYMSVFESEISVCLWILQELRNHSTSCQSCAPLPGFLDDFEDNVSFFYFHVAFAGTHLLIPLQYVKFLFFFFLSFKWTYTHVNV